MSAMTSFLAMGGYAPFVWPAFGISVAVLAGLSVASLRLVAAKKAELESLEARTGAGATAP